MVRRTPRQEPDVARARLAVVQHRLRAAGRRGAVRPHRARPLLPDGGGDGGPERVRREAAGRLSAVPEMTTGPRLMGACRQAGTLAAGARRGFVPSTPTPGVGCGG